MWYWGLNEVLVVNRKLNASWMSFSIYVYYDMGHLIISHGSGNDLELIVTLLAQDNKSK